MNIAFTPDLDSVYELPGMDSWPATYHRFDIRSVSAVRAALAAERPLLVRGEPGIGKSQLARAVAHVLQVPFLYQVINARFECSDLLYSYDAVSRLAQAQVLSAIRNDEAWEAKLAEERFVRPGVLWWAFDWESARRQVARYHRNCLEPVHPEPWAPGKGCVVLIDEIDKADADVPNGLLESFGNIGFQVPIANRSVSLPKGTTPPLVIVTTNEERELPAAFLRRCLVLQMKMPDTEAEQLEYLVARARVHFTQSITGKKVFEEAARQLLEDRQDAQRLGQPVPGPAEYLDLLRAVAELYPKQESAQLKALRELREFALRKNSQGSEP